MRENSRRVFIMGKECSLLRMVNPTRVSSEMDPYMEKA